MRPNSQYWQCARRFDGKNHRASAKTDSLAQAKEFAEDWYLERRGKFRSGELHNEKTFADAVQVFLEEYEVSTEGERSPKYVEGHKARIRLRLMPFFGDLPVSKVTAGKVQEYRVHRINTAAKSPARSTLHD